MNDDLDDEIMDSDDGFDEFSQKSGLGDVIRRNAFAKVGVVIAVLVVVIGVMVMFGDNKEEQTMSMLPDGNQVNSIPGTEEDLDQSYIDAVNEQNDADLDIALAQGTSAIPVPIKTQDTRLEVPQVEEDSEDPLHRWRMLQEERVERQLKERKAEAEPVTVLDAEQQSEAVKNMAESMIQQMESVLSRSAEESSFVVKTLINNVEITDATMANGRTAVDAEAFEETVDAEVIIPAGKIVYGQMLLEANSDIPMSVLAEMVSGPLKGWKLLGKFQVMDDAEMLSITFDMAVNDKGDQYSVNAIMLNPDTGLAAMSTDVDHRYFQRIILPAAAEFISSYAEAIEESGATTVVVAGDTVSEGEEESTDEQEVAAGISDVGEKVSEVFDEMGEVEVKIVIDAGTPIGIFFAANVVNEEEGI